MSGFISYRELGRMGEEQAAKYMRYCRCTDGRPEFFDITDFIMNYLGLEIVSVEFADPKRNTMGFLADGRTGIAVMDGVLQVEHCYRKNTIVVDSSLLRKSEQNRLRFTLAHEAAHYLLNELCDLPLAACYQRTGGGAEGGGETRCTPAELERLLAIRERYADRLGAALLMPRSFVVSAVDKYNRGRLLRVSADGRPEGRERNVIRLIAHHLKVSESALFRRLIELRLLSDPESARGFLRRRREERKKQHEEGDGQREDDAADKRRADGNILHAARKERHASTLHVKAPRDLRQTAPRMVRAAFKANDPVKVDANKAAALASGVSEAEYEALAGIGCIGRYAPLPEYAAHYSRPGSPRKNAPGMHWFEYYHNVYPRIYERLPLEVRIKLEMARIRAAAMEKRTVECPFCGHKILAVYDSPEYRVNFGIEEVKCPKCKYEGPLDIAFFRKGKAGLPTG